MADAGDEKAGAFPETGLREDDPPARTPYRRGRGGGTLGVLIVGALVAGALLAYVARDRLPGLASAPPAVTGAR